MCIVIAVVSFEEISSILKWYLCSVSPYLVKTGHLQVKQDDIFSRVDDSSDDNGQYDEMKL